MAEAYNQSHVDELVKEKKRVADARARLATEIEQNTLTDAQKKELIPQCLECDLSAYDFSDATNLCVVTDDTTDPVTKVCEDLTVLNDFDFTGSNMTEATLKEVELNDAVLLKTNMTGAKFNDRRCAELTCRTRPLPMLISRVRTCKTFFWEAVPSRLRFPAVFCRDCPCNKAVGQEHTLRKAMQLPKDLPKRFIIWQESRLCTTR